jgi:N-acetyl-gamma-glutamyl-phosphate reductase
MKNNTIRAAIIGAAGYTGGELLRLLLHHPFARVVYAGSSTFPNKPIEFVHTDLAGESGLHFSGNDIPLPECDVIFLCSGHGESKKWLAENDIDKSIRIIDLSQDYRLCHPEQPLENGRRFIYGLPEAHKQMYHPALDIANPGCFATCILLGLLPLSVAGFFRQEFPDIFCTGITGSTGAGAGLGATSHYSWRNNNVQVYKPLQHQHMAEINELLFADIHAHESTKRDMQIRFIPVRGSFTRGILACSVFTAPEWLHIQSLPELYADYYAEHPFIFHTMEQPDVKRVVNTNKAMYHIEIHGRDIVITTVIDNLLKGASGQAVQNMNLLFDLPEQAGLMLKASVY